MPTPSTPNAAPTPPATEQNQPHPWLHPFTPNPWLPSAHLQTIAGNYFRRSGAMPPHTEAVTVPVEPEHLFTQPSGAKVVVPASAILCLCHWQPTPDWCTRPTIVLVHGLEGSARSGYILGNTIRLWAQGANIIRMNMRSCGGGDALSPTIYHAGRSGDVASVVRMLTGRGCTHIVLVGYSMGGNLVVRYAGQQALLPPAQREPALRAIVGVSPLLDLAPSSAALHRGFNRFYEQRFLRAMSARLRAKARLFPALYAPLAQERVYPRLRSLRLFDHLIVARYGGFHSADDYYEQVRASRYASRLAVPTLLLHAGDDPFIHTLPETREALRANPHVHFVEPPHGGHCAFLSTPQAGDQGRWAEETVAHWLQANPTP